MPTSGTRSGRSAAATVLGMLLVGISAMPAHAESVRAKQWHLDAMRAQEMWKVSTGRGVTVAVIDSGVDDSVADLRGQVLDGRDYSELRGDEHTDLEGHGTGMAALIAATGARGSLNGSFGLAPGAKILPIRMRYWTEKFGQVDGGAEYSRVLTKAIRYAADSDAQIINISMGAPNSSGRRNVSTPELSAAVKYAIDQGKLIFAAVGNTGNTSNFFEYPAATPGVVGVGASDKEAKALPISQRGPQVDLMAPGGDIVNACAGGTQICIGSGTSAASALVSASAALVWSMHPDWTNHQVLRVLLNTAGKPKNGDERTDSIGYGTVRPRVALKTPGDPGPADEYPLPDLAASAASPSAEASAPSNSTTPPAGAGDTERAASGEGDDKNVTWWVAAGAAAAVVIGIAVTLAVLRTRRRRATLTAPPLPPLPPYSPYGHHPQQYPPYNPPPGHAAELFPRGGAHGPDQHG
ncbi:type VII secretion-associated serine protease mycosin [Streptomyces sp. NPDC017943]|uniref:type VII secretion-associated serine protease mycosin n=1 Tax=Streptomyces sp. NPDC017943 TaxID=3365019 RepID=UPI0037BA4DC6